MQSPRAPQPFRGWGFEEQSRRPRKNGCRGEGKQKEPSVPAQKELAEAGQVVLRASCGPTASISPGYLCIPRAPRGCGLPGRRWGGRSRAREAGEAGSFLGALLGSSSGPTAAAAGLRDLGEPSFSPTSDSLRAPGGRGVPRRGAGAAGSGRARVRAGPPTAAPGPPGPGRRRAGLLPGAGVAAPAAGGRAAAASAPAAARRRGRGRGGAGPPSPPSPAAARAGGGARAAPEPSGCPSLARVRARRRGGAAPRPEPRVRARAGGASSAGKGEVPAPQSFGGLLFPPRPGPARSACTRPPPGSLRAAGRRRALRSLPRPRATRRCFQPLCPRSGRGASFGACNGSAVAQYQCVA